MGPNKSFVKHFVTSAKTNCPLITTREPIDHLSLLNTWNENPVGRDAEGRRRGRMWPLWSREGGGTHEESREIQLRVQLARVGDNDSTRHVRTGRNPRWRPFWSVSYNLPFEPSPHGQQFAFSLLVLRLSSLLSYAPSRPATFISRKWSLPPRDRDFRRVPWNLEYLLSFFTSHDTCKMSSDSRSSRFNAFTTGVTRMYIHVILDFGWLKILTLSLGDVWVACKKYVLFIRIVIIKVSSLNSCAIVILIELVNMTDFQVLKRLRIFLLIIINSIL